MRDGSSTFGFSAAERIGSHQGPHDVLTEELV
jgi:hypothetical protein